ncbi:hypothetical protein [Aquimarina sp. I32.4]|uniref:hypothetical protein n=1 Tax=Aquimarina sp. I32.4 TaxID=2053903 RepID=UPI000CDF04BC|nr:hypothetical protein [Aquimarina sp. I32.4]
MIDTDFSEILLRITGIIFYIIPIIVFIILAIYYISKVGSTKEGILILIGNILLFIVAIIHQFLFMLVDSWGFNLYSIINSGVNFIAFIGSILFIIGFYLLIKKAIKGNNTTT